MRTLTTVHSSAPASLVTPDILAPVPGTQIWLEKLDPTDANY